MRWGCIAPEAILIRDESMMRTPRNNAVVQSAADKMRDFESKQLGLWSSTKDTRREVPFVRSAKPGSWRSDPPEDSVRQRERAWSPLIRWLGYELSLNPDVQTMSAQLQESILRERIP